MRGMLQGAASASGAACALRYRAAGAPGRVASTVERNTTVQRSSAAEGSRAHPVGWV